MNEKKSHKSQRGCDADNRNNKKTGLASKPKDNDATWYARNAQALADAASLAFPNVTGLPVRMANPITVGSVTENFATRKSFPGVLTLGYTSMVGIAKDAASPINVAANALYTYIRHANSGHTNYESADYIMYVLAHSELQAFLAWMKRIYGLFGIYWTKNRFVPDALIESCGVNADEFRTRLADFRLYINTFALRAGVLCTPSDITWTTRHIWMNTNVFADSPDTKAQFIMYDPIGFWKYDPTGDAEGGKLIFREKTRFETLDQLRAYGDELLSAVLDDEDCAIMSGDTLKAFGDAGVSKLTAIDEGYTCPVGFSAEVLNQIHNTRAYASEVPTAVSRIIRQSGGTVRSGIAFSFTKSAASKRPLHCSGDYIFDLPLESPTPADVMVASRNLAQIAVEVEMLGGDDNRFTEKVTVLSCGSELIEKMWLTFLDEESDSHVRIELADNMIGNVDEYFEILSQFNQYPLYQSLAAVEGQQVVENCVIAGDLNNYTTLSQTQVANMNYVALLSQFSSTRMGYAGEKL